MTQKNMMPKQMPQRSRNNQPGRPLGQKLQLIKTRINNAAIKSGRNPNNITIVAVTKTFPPGIWDTALQNQLTTIGESRIQEAENKNKIFTNRKKIELHFIGHLQGNKTRKAVQLFDVIQTIDSLKLAKRVNIISKQIKKTQKIFLQVNTAGDHNKHGLSPDETIEAAAEIVNKMNVSLIGIMTIPPNNISEKHLQYIYNKTRIIKEKIQKTTGNNCKNLSMGMSNDYETAIKEGATHIRLGTALFGERPQ